MKIGECSKAIAETLKLCKPNVISVYPITPQTSICKEISNLIFNGKMDSKYLEVESEFSALSSLIGASATGVRTFTSTSSQGLALMHELLFIASGMRLPIVMIVANRALSAPINIWCDHQDSISQRDSGWIQFYAESVQEAVDTLIQSYKIAEQTNLPIMVNIDGFYLTHVVEQYEIPAVEKFLPELKPKLFLDPKNPITQGPFAYPKFYMNLKKELYEAIESSKENIKNANKEFSNIFKRKYGNGLTEEYNINKDIIFVCMGSLCSTIKHLIDNGEEVGLLRIRCLRPFPKKEIINSLKDKKTIIILDKNISLGNSGVLFTEIRNSLYDKSNAKIINYIVGLGGADVSLNMLKNIIKGSQKKEDGEIIWQIK